MKKIIWLFLILIVHTAIIKRLDDRETSKLTTSDTLVSTLGMYRLHLKPNNCSLRIEKFNPQANAYE